MTSRKDFWVWVTQRLTKQNRNPSWPRVTSLSIEERLIGPPAGHSRKALSRECRMNPAVETTSRDGPAARIPYPQIDVSTIRVSGWIQKACLSHPLTRVVLTGVCVICGRALFSHHFASIFVSSDAKQTWMAQLPMHRPLNEAYLHNNFRFYPMSAQPRQAFGLCKRRPGYFDLIELSAQIH